MALILDSVPRISLPGVPARLVFSACLLLAGAASISAQQPADSPSHTPDQKTKKVWTNDDFAQGSANAAPTAKEADLPGRSTDHVNAQLASQLRGKLEKLQAHWKVAGQQLDELKRFQAGELSGDDGRQLHKRYNRAPIPEQIAKLEEKRKHLQDQIEAIYEEARKKGILPGELR